jgi:hypothetical protein
VVLPRDMVDNLISLSKPTSGRFYILMQSRQATFSWKKASSVDFWSQFHRPSYARYCNPRRLESLSSGNRR